VGIISFYGMRLNRLLSCSDFPPCPVHFISFNTNERLLAKIVRINFMEVQNFIGIKFIKII
jgi:hypothetical protein